MSRSLKNIEKIGALLILDCSHSNCRQLGYNGERNLCLEYQGYTGEIIGRDCVWSMLKCAERDGIYQYPLFTRIAYSFFLSNPTSINQATTILYLWSI